jgi:hypothetical protein
MIRMPPADFIGWGDSGDAGEGLGMDGGRGRKFFFGIYYI